MEAYNISLQRNCIKNLKTNLTEKGYIIECEITFFKKNSHVSTF